MPDVKSLPLKVIGTAWLYQPLTSAARAGAPPITTGAVLSSLILKSTATLASPSSATQTWFAPDVSIVIVLLVQPSTRLPARDTVHSTVTSDRYQPEQFCGAGVHLKLTLGTASASGAPNNSTIRTTATITAMPRARPPAASKGPSTAVRGPSGYCGWGRINKRGGKRRSTPNLNPRRGPVNPP